MENRRYRRISRWIPPLLVLLLLPVGLVAGAALKVTKGTSEAGFGTVVAAPPAASWWSFLSLNIVNAPAGLVVGSTNISAPTNLSSTSATSLAVSALAGGAGAALFQFQLDASAPKSTEVEIDFSVALSGAATLFTVYVETPAAALTGPLVERLYVPSPAVTFTGLTLQSYSATSAVCTSVGVCP
ncbi:MAG TPA: hypothetical protein VFG07_08700 [Thermoplasmata archaeon]|nr:hypothetical protein [Thermoplasmata archaeon]